MGIEEDFRIVVSRSLAALVNAGELPAAALGGAFAVERPKRADHGDLATNAPLALQKLSGMPPRALAERLAARLKDDPAVLSADIAGPGFLNVKLAPSAFHQVLREIERAGAGYGRAPSATADRILLEFVSANPTGPLLISHARGALVGDAVGRLLEATGHRVTREYYINDFGNQVRTFARSVAASAFGEPAPEGGYPGAYVDAVAKDLLANRPDVLAAHRADRDDDEALGALSRECVRLMLDGVPGSADLPGIKATLRSLGVTFDAWYSEESLHRWGRVGAALARLERAGYVKKLDDGALVFRMPEGEGEVDEQYEGENRDAKEKSASAGGGRVVRKSDEKTFTYFASDIAYHADKLDRGYDRLITVLGADHHGYVARMRNVLQALGLPAEKFEVLLFQLVSLMRDGKPYKMGKRLGNLITCDEVVEEIDAALGAGAGQDALRFFYLSRRTENPVELDVELAKKATLDNPAVYLQYGHARLCSILRRAAEVGATPATLDESALAHLVHPLELSLLGRAGAYPRVVREAARELQPSKVLTFLGELAQDFHSYYTVTKKDGDTILPPASRGLRAGDEGWDWNRTRARLAWVDALRLVYAAGLALIGIRAPEAMKRDEDEASS